MSELSVPLASDITALECPVNGGPCPARERLATLYGETVDPSMPGSLVEQLRPDLDSMKLNIKLGEHATQARLRGCEGPQDGSCPPWMAMTESKPRQTAVSGIRKIIGHITQ
jgi:hypothetical protein